MVHPTVHRYTLLGNPLTLGCISFKNNNLNINYWITFKRRVSTLFPSSNPLSALLHDLLLICPLDEKISMLSMQDCFQEGGWKGKERLRLVFQVSFWPFPLGVVFNYLLTHIHLSIFLSNCSGVSTSHSCPVDPNVFLNQLGMSTEDVWQRMHCMTTTSSYQHLYSTQHQAYTSQISGGKKGNSTQ